MIVIFRSTNEEATESFAVALMKRVIGTVLILLAINWTLSGLGFFDSTGSEGDPAQSPEASGRLIGVLLPALLFAGIGVWCWQKPKQ